MPIAPDPIGMSIQESEPLKPFTTFKIGGPARYFASVASVQDFRAAADFAARNSLPLFVLGGGSNILVSDAGFPGVVAHPDCRGIGIAREDPESVTLEVNAAETWDDLVRFTVEHGWWGIENLSHIPGQAGAALVQNIGAYGQQVSDVVQSAQVFEIATGAPRILSVAECGFGYRRSIFNTTARGKLIIQALTLRLYKQGIPQLDYPDVRTYFQKLGIPKPSLQEIRKAIISIRDGKFPYPREERGGNAGSFFKNLSLSSDEYSALYGKIRVNCPAQDLARLEELRSRSPLASSIKIPTAFLISICGLKGYKIGGAKVNESQPLVLLNEGGATAENVLELARHVRRTVWQRSGMKIEIEPELVGFSAKELEHLYSLD